MVTRELHDVGLLSGTPSQAPFSDHARSCTSVYLTSKMTYNALGHRAQGHEGEHHCTALTCFAIMWPGGAPSLHGAGRLQANITASRIQCCWVTSNLTMKLEPPDLQDAYLATPSKASQKTIGACAVRQMWPSMQPLTGGCHGTQVWVQTHALQQRMAGSMSCSCIEATEQPHAVWDQESHPVAKASSVA